MPIGNAKFNRGNSRFASIKSPNILNCNIAKSAYLKKPKIPMLPMIPIRKKIFFLTSDSEL